jgi:hypothetical protein
LHGRRRPIADRDSFSDGISEVTQEFDLLGRGACVSPADIRENGFDRAGKLRDV